MTMSAAAAAVSGNALWTRVLRRFFLPPLFDALEGPSPKRILEVGCARGGTTGVIRDRFPDASITAVDVDAEAIAAAQKRVAGPRVTFAVADATRLPYPDGSFDLVFELNSFHHVERWMTAVAECARVTAPGGSFAVMDENVAAWGRLFRILDRPASTFSSAEFVNAARTAGLSLKNRLGQERFMRLVFTKPGSLSHSPRP